MAIATTVVGMMWPTIDPQIGAWILIGCGVVFAGAMMVFLWPGSRNEGGGPVHQTTLGPHSPNLSGTFTGPVTFNPPPAATQPRRSPYGRTRLRDLEDDDISQLFRRPSTAEVVLRRAREEAGRCPEMPIWQALHKIAGQIGDTDEGNGFPEARRQFRQAASESRVDVWGQRDIPPAHLDDERRREVFSRIEPDHWKEYTLDPSAADEAQQDRPHTEEEEIGRHGGRYWNLKVRPEDIRQRWPKQPRTTNDGKP